MHLVRHMTMVTTAKKAAILCQAKRIALPVCGMPRCTAYAVQVLSRWPSLSVMSIVLTLP